MQRLRDSWKAFCLACPEALRAQQNGVVLLTLVPFMISGIIFAPWSGDILAELTVSPQVYLPWVALALLVLTIATALASHGAAAIISAVSAAILLAIALHGQTPLEALGLGAFAPSPAEGETPAPPYRLFTGINLTTLFALYTLTGLASFFAISVRPTLSRVLFRAVLVVLLLDLLLFSFFGGLTLAGVLFRAYFPSQISVLISLMVLMVLRMLVKFYQENRSTREATRQADPRLLRSVRRTTLRLWWPMPLIFLVFLLLYGLLNDRYVRSPMIDELNALGIDTEIEIYPGETITVPANYGDAPPDTVQQAARLAVDRIVAAQTAAITARIRAQSAEFDGDTDAVMAAARSAMPGRFPGTHTRRCGFLDIGCYIQNGIKSMINSAYVSARENMLEDFRRDLERADGSVASGTEGVVAELERRAALMGEQTKRRINDTATGLRYFGWASLLYSVLVLIKSWMIVFARVFYNRVPFRATEDSQEEAESNGRKIGRAAAKGSRLELKPTKDEIRYYIAFRACGNNVVDRRRLPQPTRIFFKRLFSRNLAMCLIDFSADRKITSCDVIVDPPAQILQWDLLPGDEVFVDMSTVIGFSESCTLGRTISLSLGSLIFGRAFYHSVRGPGQLFLRTESTPIAGAEKGTSNVMQASSLIAWKRDTRFNIVSSLTVGDTFLSGFSVRKSDPRHHLVVYDTSQSRRVGTGGGILRLVRSFLLPI